MKGVAVAAVAVSMSAVLVACTPAPTRPVVHAASATVDRWAPTTPPTPTTTPTTTAAAPESAAAPNKPGFRTIILHHGTDHPDDLVLDRDGALLYSDYTGGTISRLGPGATSTVLHRGIDGPEGLVLLPDGTLVVAEENTNRLLSFAPGRSSPTVLATLPGLPTKVTCHEGVDGIAWDGGTHSLVVPDPVTGTVYRISSDGSSRTALARGFVHPVGAAVDATGRVLVADECGGGVWRLGQGGTRVRVATAIMPDDVALDGRGALLVTDVRHTRHGLRRWPAGGGPSTVLARTGLIEPQGLLVDPAGRIYVSDDKTRLILRLTPTTG